MDGHICVVTVPSSGNSGNQSMLYPLSSRFRLEVSQSVVDTWNEATLPNDAELEKVRGH